jgi:hypothetical protein
MKEASPVWQEAAMHFESTAAVRATVGLDIGRQQVGREVGSRV